MSTGRSIHAAFEHITVDEDGNGQCDPWQVLNGPAKPFGRPVSGLPASEGDCGALEGVGCASYGLPARADLMFDLKVEAHLAGQGECNARQRPP